MKKTFLALIFLFAPIGVFAESVDVTNNLPSGTYSSPIRITLSPTQDGSKTFYSFKPDGYPGDAFLYTGSILLKHSSPFIYFSVISPTNESKIKQNNYIIDYSPSIKFVDEIIWGSGKVDVKIINTGSDVVNIGFWYIQSESDTVEVPENTLLGSGSVYNLSIDYSGNSSIVLRSPDDDEKDILIEQALWVEALAVPKKQKPIIKKIIPRKIISTNVTVPLSGDLPSVSVIPEKEPTSSIESVPENNIIPVPWTNTVNISSPVLSPATSIDINKIVKVSTEESGQKNINPLYLVALFILSGGIGIFQWYARRKQN